MMDDSLSDVQQFTKSKGYQEALKEGLEAIANAQEKKMSVEELKLKTIWSEMEVVKIDDKINIQINGTISMAQIDLDSNQAHMLMLYLQQHLGYVSISKDRVR